MRYQKLFIRPFESFVVKKGPIPCVWVTGMTWEVQDNVMKKNHPSCKRQWCSGCVCRNVVRVVPGSNPVECFYLTPSLDALPGCIFG